MTPLVWPQNLFMADTVDWSLPGGTVTGGASISGIRQVARLSGGPMWAVTLSDVALITKDALRAARSFQGMLEGGFQVVEMSPCDCDFAPLADGQSFALVPHSDGTPFSDGSMYATSPIECALTASADLRATTASLGFSGGYAPLRGGEHFSIDHPNSGRRLYRVLRVVGGTDEEPTIEFTPPLREATPAFEEVDFNRPSCLMVLVGEMRVPTEFGRWSNPTWNFVEWFGESVAAAPPPPTEIEAEDTGSGEATVSWRNPWSVKFDHARVYRGADGSDFADAVDVSGAVGTSADRGQADDFVETGLAAAIHRYWVVAESAADDQSTTPPHVDVTVT